MKKKFIGLSVVEIIGLLTLIALILGGVLCINGLIFMLLWNYVAVYLFSVPAVSFKMAVAASLFFMVIGGYFKSTRIK